ncbi:MAG: hypothetical protein Q7T82_05010 [Armatimonadota bacterium]|nr:hypothetical protein [Armatimonadota bacterium]
MRLLQVLCFISALTRALAGKRAPSGPNVIPTADVPAEGLVSLETESAGNGRRWGGECSRGDHVSEAHRKTHLLRPGHIR